MICKDCPRKPKCRKPCARLNKHLDLLTGYQREHVVEPVLLGRIFSCEAKSEPEEEWEELLEEMDLPYRVARMGYRMRAVIMGYFWEGKSIPALARRLKISRSRAQRLFETGLKKLKKAVIRNKKARKMMLPESAKFSYNKKSANEKRQDEKNRKGKNKAAS